MGDGVDPKEWDGIWGSANILHVLLGIARNFYSKYFFFLLRPYLPAGARFLEVGSGSGTLVMKVAQSGHNAFGIDISPQAISVAKREAEKKQSKAKFILGDCYNLPFRPLYFDLVWSQGVLEELDRPLESLREQYRVLKKNGAIIASVPAKHSWLWVWRQLTKNRLLSGFWPWPDHLFYEKGPLLTLGRQVSEGAKVRSAGLLHELLLLEIRKK